MPARELHICNGALDARAVTRYKEDGAVLARGILDAAILKTATSALLERLDLLERTTGITPESGADDSVREASRRLQALERERPGMQGSLYDSMSEAPALHQTASHPALLQSVSALLSPSLSVHPRLIMLMSMPQGTWHLALWHQDWYYNEGPQSTVTAYAPLQHTDSRNGSLLLALGHHRQGLLPHGDFESSYKTKWHTIPQSEVERFDTVVPTVVEPGDVLFLDSMLPHSAQLNTSDDVRFVMNFRYRDLTDPDYLRANWKIDAIAHARNALSRKQ